MKKGKILRKVICILVAVSLVIGSIVGGAGAFFSNSQVQKPIIEKTSSYWQNGTFGIEFPQTPVVTEEKIKAGGKNLQFHSLTSTIKEADYSLTYFDFPGHWKLLGTKKFLTKSFNAMIEKEGKGSEVLEKQLTTYQGYPALIYKIQDSEGIETFGRLIVVRKTLYRLVVKSPDAALDSQTFFNSLSFKK